MKRQPDDTGQDQNFNLGQDLSDSFVLQVDGLVCQEGQRIPGILVMLGAVGRVVIPFRVEDDVLCAQFLQNVEVCSNLV